MQERYEVEAEEMRRRVKTEKNLRKACEKWLRSELKSRVGGRGCACRACSMQHGAARG